MLLKIQSCGFAMDGLAVDGPAVDDLTVDGPAVDDLAVGACLAVGGLAVDGPALEFADPLNSSWDCLLR